MIAIWGGGSAGIRYKTLIEELGYKTILLSRDKNLNSFDFNTLNISKIEAAIICTPTVFHSEQSKLFLKNEIPVLCEKPISHNYTSGKSIVETARKYETKFHVGYNQRFLKAFKIFKDKRWGKPIKSKSIWAERVSDWQPDKNFKESYSVRPDLGGGAPLTLSHDFDWWTGIYTDLAVKDVSSSNDGTLGITIDTKFEVSLMGSVECDVILNYEIDGPPIRYYETEYEGGTLKYEPLNSSLFFLKNNGEKLDFKIENDWNNTRLKSFQDTFCHFIEDERRPSELSDWELGLTALNVASIVNKWND